MPQPASEFSVRTTPSPNCRRCERAYNMLHFHERLSMPVVRGNIRALGGPGLLVSTYKRQGLKGLDVNQTFTQRRHRRSCRSDAHVESKVPRNGTVDAEDSKKSAVQKEEHTKAEEGTAPETGTDKTAGAENSRSAKDEAAEKVGGGKCEQEAKNSPSKADTHELIPVGQAQPATPAVVHTQEELDMLGKYGGIKIIEIDLGKRFVYKRKRMED